MKKSWRYVLGLATALLGLSVGYGLWGRRAITLLAASAVAGHWLLKYKFIRYLYIAKRW